MPLAQESPQSDFAVGEEGKRVSHLQEHLDMLSISRQILNGCGETPLISLSQSWGPD